MLLVTVCMFAFYFKGFSQATLVITPSNVAVVQGTDAKVTMKCSTDGESDGKPTKLRWYKINSGSSVGSGTKNNTLIFTGNQILDSATYSIDKSTQGQFDLTILTVTLATAGTYVCDEPGSESRSSAELVVLASDPQCSFNQSVSTVEMSCNVAFQGTWAPVMEWKLGNKVATAGITNITIFNSSITYTLLVPLNPSIPGSRRYTCTTKFVASMKPENVYASNIPSYEGIWEGPGIEKIWEAPDVENSFFSTYAVEKTPVLSTGIVIPCALFLGIVTGTGILFVALLHKRKRIANNLRDDAVVIQPTCGQANTPNANTPQYIEVINSISDDEIGDYCSIPKSYNPNTSRGKDYPEKSDVLPTSAPAQAAA